MLRCSWARKLIPRELFCYSLSLLALGVLFQTLVCFRTSSRTGAEAPCGWKTCLLQTMSTSTSPAINGIGSELTVEGLQVIFGIWFGRSIPNRSPRGGATESTELLIKIPPQYIPVPFRSILSHLTDDPPSTPVSPSVTMVISFQERAPIAQASALKRTRYIPYIVIRDFQASS